MPLWEIYSYFYGLSLTNLFPYRRLLEDLNGALHLKEGESVLDAGCGPGLLIERVLQANSGKSISVTGVDLSRRMIERARRTCKSPNVRLQVADLNKGLEFPDGSFDKVVCSNTLYALENPRSTVAEFRRVLRPEGMVTISNPKPNAGEKELVKAHIAEINRLTPARRRARYIATTIVLIPVHLAVIAINIVISRKGRSSNYHFLDKDELERILRETGFKNIRISSCYAGQNWLVTADK